MPSPSPPSRPASGSGALPEDAYIGRTIGRYQIVERLGRGGMGVVYRAADSKLGREVALKFLAPDLHANETARQRLFLEARAIAAMDHPHVASLYDIVESETGQLFLAMAYYEGETLEQMLAQGPLAPEVVVELGQQIASGLGAVHREGIVHRDVKPANVIVVDENGKLCAKVLDFGIAKTEEVGITRTGESVGTALYMSPEQLRGDGLDGRADVWALGAVIYEMLSGQRPFRGSYAAAIGYAVLNDAPRPLPNSIPDPLRAVVMRCLSKAPEARFASMEALSEALQSSVAPADPLPAEEQRESSVPATRSPSARLWRWSAAVVSVLVLALAWIALRPGAPEVEAAAQRLVVLPFTAIGDDAEPLAEGLVEAVTGKLSQLAPLRGRVTIVPASEVASGIPSSEARERFGADLVVEGTVQTEGDRTRVTITLSDVASGERAQIRGSREVDDASGSAFIIQDETVVQVADLLRVEIGTETRSTLSAGGTENPEANRLYLRGLGVLRNQQSVDDLARARALFADAIALDNEFALAHAALAEAQWQTYRRTSDVDWADRALASGRRALELDDGLAEVHLALGVMLQGRGEYPEAHAALARALELDPQNSEVVRRQAKVYEAQEDTVRATESFKHAIALAPDFWRPYNSFGVYYLSRGRAPEAAEQFRKGLKLNPTNVSLLINLGAASSLAGNLREAEEAFGEVLRLAPENALAASNLATVRFSLGDYPGAVEMGRTAVELQPEDYAARLGLAEALWWTPGQREQAREEFEVASVLIQDHLRIGRSSEVLLAMVGASIHTGREVKARDLLRELERDLTPEAADVQDAYAMGVAYELLGERPRALVWLRSAFSRGFGKAQAETSPWLADLRSSPSYASLLRVSS